VDEARVHGAGPLIVAALTPRERERGSTQALGSTCWSGS
jgi:hypothetical protein